MVMFFDSVMNLVVMILKPIAFQLTSAGCMSFVSIWATPLVAGWRPLRIDG